MYLLLKTHIFWIFPSYTPCIPWGFYDDFNGNGIERRTWQDKPKTSCRYKASVISCSCIKYLPSSIPEVHTCSKAHFGQQLQFRPLPGPTQQAPEEHSQSHLCPSSALTLTEVKKGNFSKPQHNHRKPNEEPNAVIPWASNRRVQCTTHPILLCQRTLSSRNHLISDVALLQRRWQSLTKHEVLVLGPVTGNMCGQKSWNPAAPEIKVVSLTGLDLKGIIST